ncbi:hypothetical protein BGZ61DRAFT_471922 [Ilyonectria robusta]|uniref:uncharacterized protein n=1 Tax=Ilyonectria robusta TaxID=1079257 RepID=UPI001E8E416C|nr:uncharacterized protein BGZ61DRAFT_471922 [Ilyonectria robusta]KAH8735490.1 hypothetical protein BGZ61DRAFT_471922 [Ilyonectria robusta]
MCTYLPKVACAVTCGSGCLAAGGFSFCSDEASGSSRRYWRRETQVSRIAARHSAWGVWAAALRDPTWDLGYPQAAASGPELSVSVRVLPGGLGRALGGCHGVSVAPTTTGTAHRPVPTGKSPLCALCVWVWAVASPCPFPPVHPPTPTLLYQPPPPPLTLTYNPTTHCYCFYNSLPTPFQHSSNTRILSQSPASRFCFFCAITTHPRLARAPSPPRSPGRTPHSGCAVAIAPPNRPTAQPPRSSTIATASLTQPPLFFSDTQTATMLLPSALSCDSSQPSQSRLQPSLFSPPASPPALSSQNALANIMSTCRNLQSLLASPAPIVPDERPMPTLAQLPTPPLAHAPPPLKLRLRSRGKPDVRDDHLAPRKRITKRAPPRGVNKRRRAADDDMGRHDFDSDSDMQDSDLDADSLELQEPADNEPVAPATPKRARIAPEQLPLGLERSDFHDVHRQSDGNDSNNQDEDVDGDGWNAEDDRILVELVLEKLKLSKSEWQDCARSLGRDRHAVNRRWKSLILGGDVGMKPRAGRRARLHSTWR